MLSLICVSLLVAAAVGTSPFTCPSDAGVNHVNKYPDPSDCASYFDCTHGIVAWHKTCGTGTVFNPKFQICDWPFNVECPTPPEKNCFKACPRLYNPVCGSDGQTYDNECLLNVATCESDGSIVLKAAGKCEEEEKNCFKTCPRLYNPVCGTDGQTYGNPCQLEVVTCESNGAITQQSAGKCQDEEEEESCFKPCGRLHMPVCGTDGTTYPNPCELSIATCQSNGAISQKHEGQCTTEEEATGYDDRKCWFNKVQQKMTLLEGTDARLDGKYKKRENAIEKCQAVAADGAFDYFAVGNKGQCWGGQGDSYLFYGESKKCPKNGKGKYGVVHVYELHKPAPPTTIAPEVPVDPEVPVPEPTIACGDLTCKTNTQYCSGGFWTSYKCKELRATGNFCTSSRQCLSGSCSWSFCQ